jgi:hypothetical protein
VLEAAEDVGVVDLPTLDEAAVFVGAAVVGLLVADVGLAGLGLAALGLPATMGATVEMLLIFTLAASLMFKMGLTNRGIGRLVETFSGGRTWVGVEFYCTAPSLARSTEPGGLQLVARGVETSGAAVTALDTDAVPQGPQYREVCRSKL